MLCFCYHSAVLFRHPEGHLAVPLCCWHPCCCSSLLLQGGGEGGDKEEQEVELPFPSIPHPDYEAEQPQEQTPPEPDNPLPASLPSNHPDEVRRAWLLALHMWPTLPLKLRCIWACVPPHHAMPFCCLQAPKGPEPEVPLPRREPDMPQFPPDVSGLQTAARCQGRQSWHEPSNPC